MKKLLLIALLIVGCEETTEPEVFTLVGLWDWIETKTVDGDETTIIVPDEDNQETYVYNADGTYSHYALVNGNEGTGNGTYSIDNTVNEENTFDITEISDAGESGIAYFIIVDINIITFSYTSGSNSQKKLQRK